ncbi:hypothetical protein GCM10010156_75750 [Planobispora rosea]|uniref:Uncharacterized protein n=1 Tax=Planobispora rosea TaxID=35762 RepID=A0A8J3SAI7_PLARO|nr:hypothetical protein GCM10010156_75750 [Planobispora rosea]GIH89112.1 hypothetical protein Pro02_75200 [Planobispora rosea]
MLTDRMVKYIANSAAKNMSSEDSQTIVPTLTMSGLLDEWAVVVVGIADAVATGSIIAAPLVGSPHDPPLGGSTASLIWTYRAIYARGPPLWVSRRGDR